MREKRGTTFFSKISSRKDVNSYSTSKETKKRKRRASVTVLRIMMNSQYGARTSVATGFSNWATLMVYNGIITAKSMCLVGLKRSSVTGDPKIKKNVDSIEKMLEEKNRIITSIKFTGKS